MEIHQLRYFVAVADEGSFSRAAAKVRVAQPSLSQQIRKLETEIGQPLFDRLPRSVLGRARACRARRRRFEHVAAGEYAGSDNASPGGAGPLISRTNHRKASIEPVGALRRRIFSFLGKERHAESPHA